MEKTVQSRQFNFIIKMGDVRDAEKKNEQMKLMKQKRKTFIFEALKIMGGNKMCKTRKNIC